MKKLSLLFRIYTECTMAAVMAVGCFIELFCALGLYLLNAPVLASCALVAAGFFALAANGFAVTVYSSAKRSNLI